MNLTRKMLSAVASSIKKADRISTFTDSIWVEFTPLCNKHNAVNLGQGFPNWPVAEFVKGAIDETKGETTAYQYTRAMGDMALVETLGRVYSPLFERKIDPLKEVMVTNGASGGLNVVMNAFFNDGDEVPTACIFTLTYGGPGYLYMLYLAR